MSRRGCWVLGPMLEYWDYPIPETWDCRASAMGPARTIFRVLSAAKGFYYRYLW